jgi:hypothetical protein
MKLMGFEVEKSDIKPAQSAAIDKKSKFKAKAGKLQAGITKNQFRELVCALSDPTPEIVSCIFERTEMVEGKENDVVVEVTGYFKKNILIGYSVFKSITP